jgi:hypothetical protein
MGIPTHVTETRTLLRQVGSRSYRPPPRTLRSSPCLLLHRVSVDGLGDFAQGIRKTIASTSGVQAKPNRPLSKRGLDQRTKYAKSSRDYLHASNRILRPSKEVKVPFLRCTSNTCRSASIAERTFHTSRRTSVGSTRAARTEGIREAATATTNVSNRTPA